MSLNNYIEMLHGVNPNSLTDVSITKMTKEQHEISRRVVEMKQCFANSFNLAHQLGATYVLGIYQDTIPIEHAWLKVGDLYIDPTLEIVKDGNIEGKYMSLIEIPADELIDFILEVKEESKSNDCYPPSFDRVRYVPRYKDDFVSSLVPITKVYSEI